MFVNYAELLLPSNSSVCIAWSLDSYSQAHKIRLCFLSFFKKQSKKKNTKQRRYFKMIICLQQGGINLTVLDPRSAYNWLTLQSCGLDYL